MKTIYLIGMMGCGKSTCARLLGEKLGLPVLDTDEEIQRRAGMTVSESFAYRGEAEVRQRERELRHTLAGGEDRSVAGV